MQIMTDSTSFYEKATDVDFDVDMLEIDSSGKFHCEVFIFFLLSL